MFTVRARLDSVKWLRFQKGGVKHSVWCGSLNTSDAYIISPPKVSQKWSDTAVQNTLERKQKVHVCTCICRTRKPSNSRDRYHFFKKIISCKKLPIILFSRTSKPYRPKWSSIYSLQIHQQIFSPMASTNVSCLLAYILPRPQSEEQSLDTCIYFSQWDSR